MHLNSKIFSDTGDLSQSRNKLNPYVSADDLVNSNSYKNLIPTDQDSSVQPVSSHSENVIEKKTESFKFGGELDNVIKQVLLIDDDLDSAITIRSCLES